MGFKSIYFDRRTICDEKTQDWGSLFFDMVMII
jgi:hypothetical protein